MSGKLLPTSGRPRSGARRTTALAAAGMLALLLGTGCSALSPEPQPEVVLIAADLELSGEGSQLGAIYRNALELRVDQVNQQGLLGHRRLELQVTDNRTNDETAAANIKEFTGNDAVTAIITGGCSACLLAAVDSVNTVGVPTIALAGSDVVASPVEDRRYVFKLGPNPADSARALAAELDASGVGSVALVISDNQYGEDGLREMTGALSRLGVDLVIEERVTQEDEMLQAAADRVARYEPPVDPLQPVPVGETPTTGPDAVVVWAYAPTANRFAVQLRELGYTGKLLLDMAAADNLFLTGSAGAALSGATMVFTETLVIDEVVATSPAKTARKTWFNAYTARYGTYHAFASFAADAVQLVVEAVNQVDTADRTAVRAAIERTQLDGLTGPLRITPDNHSGLTSLALTTLVARGDRWRPAG